MYVHLPHVSALYCYKSHLTLLAYYMHVWHAVFLFLMYVCHITLDICMPSFIGIFIIHPSFFLLSVRRPLPRPFPFLDQLNSAQAYNCPHQGSEKQKEPFCPEAEERNRKPHPIWSRCTCLHYKGKNSLLLCKLKQTCPTIGSLL